jgi:colanic acid/amylovoran biosynthesis glycosyltransferase
LVQEVADYIARHGLAGRVALRGFVPHAELPALLSATDVFVHPSRRAPDGDMEGPVVANMEALATGCPVISTWHGDIPEVVQDGRNGILAAENDVEALRAAICRFYHMGAGEYAAFGEHGRAHVAAHYNVVREGQRLRDLYAEIAGPCA